MSASTKFHSCFATAERDPGGSSVEITAPASGALTDNDFGSFGHSTYSLSNRSFDFSFNEGVGATAGSLARTFIVINFSVDEVVDYVISGIYDGVNLSNGGLDLNAVLTQGPANVLFANSQATRGAPEASLRLGELGGNFSNNLEGALTGALMPGEIFSWLSKPQLEILVWTLRAPRCRDRNGVTDVCAGGRLRSSSRTRTDCAEQLHQTKTLSGIRRAGALGSSVSSLSNRVAPR